MLILAWRYGFQPEDDNPKKLSITHLEYEEAVRLKKPCLAFLLDSEYGWPPRRFDPNALSSRSKIGKFRQTLENATAGVSSPRLTASPPPSSNPCARKSRST